MTKTVVCNPSTFKYTATTTMGWPVLTTLERFAVLQPDNAPIHTSHEFTDNIGQWKEQKLRILPIEPYSRALSLIEIFWRNNTNGCFLALTAHLSPKQNLGYQLNAGQFKVKPLVVSLSNHERLDRPPFDKALMSAVEWLRANG